MKSAFLLLLSILTVVLMAEERKEMPTIEEVKVKYEDRLLDLPTVVSVGIGRASDGGKVIVIGIDEKWPETEQVLPSELEGYPVRVEIIGVPKAQ